jgi:adenylyl cyclase-associated protein
LFFSKRKKKGIQIYLPKTSLDTEIVTATSSEMNVILPGKTDADDPIELPIPEQFKTTVKNNKLHTGKQKRPFIFLFLTLFLQSR